jgi:hypothetical protein
MLRCGGSFNQFNRDLKDNAENIGPRRTTSADDWQTRPNAA